jgi:hypothetical protein
MPLPTGAVGVIASTANAGKFPWCARGNFLKHLQSNRAGYRQDTLSEQLKISFRPKISAAAGKMIV